MCLPVETHAFVPYLILFGALTGELPIPNRQESMIIELAVQVGGGSVVVVSGGASTIKGPRATWAHICPATVEKGTVGGG